MDAAKVDWATGGLGNRRLRQWLSQSPCPNPEPRAPEQVNPSMHSPPTPMHRTARMHAGAAKGGPGIGFTINDPGERHPLRPYWEYLCYLFRQALCA